MNLHQKQKRLALLSLVLHDRVGIVAGVTDFAFEHQSNVELTHAKRVGDLFSMQMVVSGSEESISSMKEALHREFPEASVHMVDMSSEDGRMASGEHPNYKLHLYAFDSEGIISQTSRVLANHKASVVDLAGCSFEAPFSGSPLLYVAMDVLATQELAGLEEDLERLGAEMDWDIALEPVSVKDETHATKMESDTPAHRLVADRGQHHAMH